MAAHGGRVIKSIGDSVLFVHDDAVAAVATAEEIIDAVGRDTRLPDVRLGLATGSVVMRMGDVFGRPVNLAARLTAVARRNRVIVDEATAAAAAGRGLSRTRRMPARPIHGFGLVEPLTLRAVTADTGQTAFALARRSRAGGPSQFGRLPCSASPAGAGS